MQRWIVMLTLFTLCFLVGHNCATQTISQPLIQIVERTRPTTMQDESTKALLTYYASMYVSRDGGKPDIAVIRMMVNAAYTTATIFPDFGPKDYKERVCEHLSYGYGETRWTAGNVSYNLPRYTPRVRRFSVDCYWPGLNEVHLYGKHNIRKEAVRLQQNGVIPPDINLMWFPARATFSRAHADYARQHAAGVRPGLMRFHVRIDESSQDDITSALLYRIMIERTRDRLGMKAEYYSKSNRNAKKFLLKNLDMHDIK